MYGLPSDASVCNHRGVCTVNMSSPRGTACVTIEHRSFLYGLRRARLEPCMHMAYVYGTRMWHRHTTRRTLQGNSI